MAGPFDFTGQNIEDTYQRLVQVSGSSFCDGTGSAITLTGTQNLQQVTDQGSVTTTPITASIISASKIDSFINIVGENGLGSPPPGAHELIFAEAGLGAGFLRLKTDTNPSAGQRLAYTPSIGELNTPILRTTQISLEGVNVFERNLTDKNNFIGNTIDNKTIVKSPMFEIVDLYTTGSITASGDISAKNLTLSGILSVNTIDITTGSSTGGVGVGNLVLQNNTGNYASGFGYSALQNNTGDYSNGFGAFTLQNNTGDYVSGFGFSALQNNTGDYSNGFGFYTLRNNTGDYSNGFGYYTLRYNTGDHSNGFGYSALQNNTGTYSNGFGAFALNNNKGDYSNGFGYSALYRNTGSNNTAIGHQSGFAEFMLEGSNNTFLGANATYASSSSDTLENSTAVGANITLTNSNTVILGSGSNVGIGTTSPGEKLEVTGNISSSNKIKAKDYLIEGNTLADIVTAFGVDGTIGIGDTSKPLAIVGSNIGTVAPFSASIVSASNTIHAKSLRLPQGIVPSEGAIYFGSSPADNNGVIYDDGTALVLGYNDGDKVRIADTNPQVTITGNLKLLSTAGGHITASGNISASGTATFNALVAAGLSYPTIDGDANQIIITDGAGNLTFANNSSEATHIECKNTSGDTLTKGTPVYITGTVGSSTRLEVAAADASDSAKMPAVGVLESDLADNAEGFVAQGGYLRQLSTATIDGTSTNSNDTIYVKAGGGLTMTKPTGSALIQNIAKVARSHASAGSIIVSSILRTNDVPNLLQGQIFFGSGSNQMQQLHISGALDTTVINNITASGDISSSGNITAQSITLGSGGAIYATDTSGNTNDTAIANLADLGIIFGDVDMLSEIQGSEITLDSTSTLKIDSDSGDIQFQDNDVTTITFDTTTGHITASGNISASGTITADSFVGIIDGGTF